MQWAPSRTDRPILIKPLLQGLPSLPPAIVWPDNARPRSICIPFALENGCGRLNEDGPAKRSKHKCQRLHIDFSRDDTRPSHSAPFRPFLAWLQTAEVSKIWQPTPAFLHFMASPPS
jgi:hypothetical protein